MRNSTTCTCCPKPAGKTYWPACSLKCYQALKFWSGVGAGYEQRGVAQRRDSRPRVMATLLFPHRGKFR